MAKIVDKELMRGKIMRAALTVFERTGFHAATIGDIAAQAKLGKGTLYLYFKGKDDLTTALIGTIFEDLEARLMTAKSPNTLAEFLAQTRASIDVSEDQARVIRVFFDIFGPSFASDEFVANIAAFFDRLGAYYAGHIAHLQKSDKIDSSLDAALTGRVLVSMLDGIVLHRGLFEIAPERHAAMADAAMIMVGNALRPGQFEHAKL